MVTLRMHHWAAILGVCSVATLGCDRKQHPLEPNGPGPRDVVPGTTPVDPPMNRPMGENRPLTDNEKRGEKDAEADIEGAKGLEIEGEAKLTRTASGVHVSVELEDAPVGTKAVHIHEKGDCSDIPGQSMGSHFAPQGHAHALPDQGQRHLGDLGNIQVGDDGKGKLEITVEGASLKEGDVSSFLGKAVVVHEGADKGSAEQPSGASGKPIACGVIKS